LEEEIHITWAFVPQPGGYYKLKCSNGLFLDSALGREESNSGSQLWQLTPSDNGNYNIKSKSGKFLGFQNCIVHDAAVSVSPNNNRSVSAKWQLIKRTGDGRRMMPFNPATQGFHFANTFAGVDASHRYGGLCGGMVYAALDYLNARKAIPPQTCRPANRTPLQSFIYGRQANSAQEDNWDKWQEMRMDALGARDAEFFEWGIRGYNGGRLEELRNAIDANRYVPLGLYSGRATGMDREKSGDHQVLAIGYALGRYTGNLQGHPEDLKIFVYNPNYPDRTMTLVPDMANKCYFELESGICWRSYFVNSKYRPKTPIDVWVLNANEPDGRIRHIYVEFGTGGDDLRGGNDNVHFTINYKDGSSQTFQNVNGLARWVDNYSETVPLALNKEISIAMIRDITLTTTFGGGAGGDNWNLDWLHITNGGDLHILKANMGENDPKPMFRFTGDRKVFTYRMP
jgi:hypothetical protein